MEKIRVLGRCQVRSGTDHPCGEAAVTEVWGVLFCAGCAREQEVYSAIGEISWEPSSDDVRGFVEEARQTSAELLNESGRLLKAASEERL